MSKLVSSQGLPLIVFRSGEECVFARGMLIALQKMFVLIAMGMLTFLWGVLVSMRVDFVAVRGVLVFMCAMPVLWEMIFGKQGVPVCLCKWFTSGEAQV